MTRSRADYTKHRRRVVIFKNLALAGGILTLVGVVGVVGLRGFCLEGESPCAYNVASWSVTGAGAAMGIGGLVSWLVFAKRRDQFVESANTASRVQLAPTSGGIGIRF